MMKLIKSSIKIYYIFSPSKWKSYLRDIEDRFCEKKGTQNK